MPDFFSRLLKLSALGGLLLQSHAFSQAAGAPRVVIPTGSRKFSPVNPVIPTSRILYDWKTHITATIFWIGELPTERNPTPNNKSSWDQAWAENFGGFDDPDPANRIANHATGDFRPKAFIPKLNPFYIALPYNDVKGWGAHKQEAAGVIPWFSRIRPKPGKTVLKGRWIEIYHNKRSCYAQWEDCGPWVTDDWEYVFGKKPPKATQNGAAGIDLSPAIRDYLAIGSGQKVHWRFVEEGQVPYGPWKKYASPTTSPVREASRGGSAPLRNFDDLEAQRKYLEYLRKLRDDKFARTPLKDL